MERWLPALSRRKPRWFELPAGGWRLEGRYIAGAYRRDGAALYVSRGIGVGAVPLRFGAPPEIDLLVLRRPAAKNSLAA